MKASIHLGYRILSSPAFRLAVSALLLFSVFSLIDVGESMAVLGKARLDWVLLGLAIGLLGKFYGAWRWYILLHGKNPEVTYLRIVKLSFVSMFLGFVLPGTISVEVARVYGLSRSTSDVGLALASVMVERVLAVTALFALALIALALSPPGLPAELAWLAWLGLFGLAAGTAAIMNRSVRRLTLLMLSPRWLTPLRLRLARFYDCMDAYSQQRGLLFWSIVAATASPVFRIVPVIIGAWALGLDISVYHIVIFVPIIVFVAQLPISLGGLGVREIGFVSLFGLVGLPAELAVALSLLLYATAVVGSLPGAWFFVREGLSPKRPSEL